MFDMQVRDEQLMYTSTYNVYVYIYIYTDICVIEIELVNFFTWERGMRYRHKSQRTGKIIF